jgi:annexin A7/11
MITGFKHANLVPLFRWMMAGIGCDEKRVISILGHRTQAQRLAVADAYHRQFGEILSHRLKSELHNNLEVCFFSTVWVGW